MIVYRWEHEDGRGPYHRDFSIFDFEGGPFNLERHNGLPKASRDVINAYRWTENAACGFVLPEQEAAWFTPLERDQMRALNIRLRTYDVPEKDIRYGKQQCMFLKQEAKRL